jgi:hypothetical protein
LVCARAWSTGPVRVLCAGPVRVLCARPVRGSCAIVLCVVECGGILVQAGSGRLQRSSWPPQAHHHPHKLAPAPADFSKTCCLTCSSEASFPASLERLPAQVRAESGGGGLPNLPTGLPSVCRRPQDRNLFGLLERPVRCPVRVLCASCAGHIHKMCCLMAELASFLLVDGRVWGITNYFGILGHVGLPCDPAGSTGGQVLCARPVHGAGWSWADFCQIDFFDLLGSIEQKSCAGSCAGSCAQSISYQKSCAGPVRVLGTFFLDAFFLSTI